MTSESVSVINLYTAYRLLIGGNEGWPIKNCPSKRVERSVLSVLLHQFPSCTVLVSLSDLQTYFSAEILSYYLAFRLSVSHLLYESNSTGFTIMGIFEPNTELQKRIKKFLGDYWELSCVYFISPVFFEKTKMISLSLRNGVAACVLPKTCWGDICGGASCHRPKSSDCCCSLNTWPHYQGLGTCPNLVWFLSIYVTFPHSLVLHK